jgi:hypothetical protein
MPSSISGSEVLPARREALLRPGFLRLTASDRPGVAQPVPQRDIPPRPWGSILLQAAVLSVLLVAGWELYWRAAGATPGYYNSNGEWAQQRRRIDDEEGDKTVLLGASRVLFDVQLPVWEKETGERPIQLAIEGTSPVAMLEDLAADPNFTGRLVVGVAPQVFFAGLAFRGDVLPYYRKEGPSQRIGNWLSMHLLEPWFAFYSEDFKLDAVIKRQGWPARTGLRPYVDPRKLAVSDADRSTHVWDKVVTDSSYRELARNIWRQTFGHPWPGMETPEKAQKVIDEQITRAAAAVATLRARGVPVVFVRPPSAGEYYAYEQKYFPRAETWDLLLKRTGAPGIHFDDYPQLQGYYLPEWSHIAASDAVRFTAALAPIVEREFKSSRSRTPRETPMTHHRALWSH